MSHSFVIFRYVISHLCDTTSQMYNKGCMFLSSLCLQVVFIEFQWLSWILSSSFHIFSDLSSSRRVWRPLLQDLQRPWPIGALFTGTDGSLVTYVTHVTHFFKFLHNFRIQRIEYCTILCSNSGWEDALKSWSHMSSKIPTIAHAMSCSTFQASGCNPCWQEKEATPLWSDKKNITNSNEPCNKG